MYRTELIFGDGKQARKKASHGKVKIGGTHHGQSGCIEGGFHSHDELLSAADRAAILSVRYFSTFNE